MNQDILRFRITRLHAGVPEGVPVEWQGREYSSGPLEIELDPESGESRGALDYTSRRAEAEFHVRMKFPQFAETLTSLGADPALAEPVRAVLRSEGDIEADHGFKLAGACRICEHPLMRKAKALVLPGH